MITGSPLNLDHHLGGRLLVAVQGDLGLVVAIDLQRLLYASVILARAGRYWRSW